MTRDELVSDRLYYVEDSQLWFYTPDGRGGYWYESQYDAFAQHGRQKIYHIEFLTDW